MQPIRLGLVGYGKIAQDQHVPAINANPAFQLVSVATQGRPCAGVENFQSLSELLERGPHVDAIAFCTPPQGRFALVRQALAAGKHVLVEKPPCATLGEAMALVDQAGEQGVSGLFAWHSRYAPGIEAARDWLATPHPAKRADRLEGRRSQMAPRPGMDLATWWPGRLRSGHQRLVDCHPSAAAAAVR